jgi:sugar lactone lactonase YvrE/enterochelin esterase-like enzyme
MLYLFFLFVLSASAQEYSLGPDSQRQPGVLKGAVTQQSFTSRVFPGTVRDYWVYVPSQYDSAKPTPFMIFQDGGGMVREDGPWRVPLVFDNLIHKKEMPVTIAIFINPGVLPAQSPDHQARFDRSFEYDALGGRYAQFLVEEIIPEVAKKFNLSNNPDDRAIAGSSSGGIAAFTAAWERPDQFRRVVSFIGSFVNLRGGQIYPTLIRKTEPKPLRVFLQDGRNDQNIYSGNWFVANEDMASALDYAGYDHKFVIGSEAHNSRHGSAILPEVLRWIWRDYPKPVLAGKPVLDRHFLSLALDPDSNWELVSEGYRFSEGPAVDRQGNVYFTDIPNNRIHKIGLDGKVSVFKENTGGANGLMFGPDGRLYACQNGRKRIVAYSMDGLESAVAEDVNSNDLAITSKGEIYFTDPGNRRVWFVDASGAKRVVSEKAIEFPNGVALSPDQSLLAVADYRGKWVWSFQIKPDGSLDHGIPFYRLETPDDSSFSAADGIKFDTEGHLWVATRLGIQVCDQPGRVVGILNKPHPGALANLVFGGPGLDWVYVTAQDRVYKRHVQRKGLTSSTLLKPPPPRL